MTPTHALPRHLRPKPMPAAVRGALIALLAITASQGLLPKTVWAAEPSTASSERQRYDIAPGPLDETLASFAARAGINITMPPNLVAGKRSGGLKGEFTVAQALNQLLAGSGLDAVGSGRSYVLKQLPQIGGEAGDTQLAPVKVTASGLNDGTTEGTGSYTTRSMSSATHLPLTMRETPQSVTVLTQARIEADNLVDLVDIAKTTPGLSLTSSDIKPRVLSRGYEVESITQDGIATQYYAGDGDSLGNLAMQDRVEVVRGATGLMQGGGNPSAAINMIRKRPTSTWQFKGSVSAGSWDDYRLMADISGPLTEDRRVRARVVGYGQDAGDFFDTGFNDKRLGYATIDIDLSDRTTLNIGYSQLYSNKNYHTWGGLPTSYGYQHLDLPRSTFTGADWEYNKNRADTFYISLAHDFGGGWNLSFNGTYVDGSFDQLATLLLPTPGGVGYGHVWSAYEISREQKAADINVSGPTSWFGRTHNLAFGASFNRQNLHTSSWWGGWSNLITSGVDPASWNHSAPRPDTSSTSPSLFEYSMQHKQDSLYSAGKFNLTNTLDLLLGARLDWYEREYSYGGTSYSENANLTKYAGLTWKFVDQHSAYVSYTDVFQPQNVHDLSGSLLDPKVGKNYEVGVKGEYLSGALNSSIALFRIDESNRAAWLSDQSACPVAAGCYAATGLVRTEGVDIELQGALTPNWQIGAGLTWSETRYREDADPANIGKRLDTANPTTLFKLSTQYTLPGALNRLTLGGRVNWQSKIYWDGENASGEIVRNQQDARAIVDLSATYRLTKNLNLKLDINNVFDKVYYSSIGSYGWYWGATEAYGRPRSVLLTMNASY